MITLSTSAVTPPFYGTDLEILLKGLEAETLILVGGLTDVCVHYTFVDAHEADCFCRVIEDCVARSSLDAHQTSLKAVEYLQHRAVRTLDEVLSAMQAYGSFRCSERCSRYPCCWVQHVYRAGRSGLLTFHCNNYFLWHPDDREPEKSKYLNILKE